MYFKIKSFFSHLPTTRTSYLPFFAVLSISYNNIIINNSPYVLLFCSKLQLFCEILAYEWALTTKMNYVHNENKWP